MNATIDKANKTEAIRRYIQLLRIVAGNDDPPDEQVRQLNSLGNRLARAGCNPHIDLAYAKGIIEKIAQFKAAKNERCDAKIKKIEREAADIDGKIAALQDKRNALAGTLATLRETQSQRDKIIEFFQPAHQGKQFSFAACADDLAKINVDTSHAMRSIGLG